MTHDDLSHAAAEEANDPRARTIFIGGIVASILACLIALGALYVAYSSARDQAESGNTLAAQVARSCADGDPDPPDIERLCENANRVIEDNPLPEPEHQEQEIQQEEIQEPELQEREIQEPEHQTAEQQERERQQIERQDREFQNPEINQLERQEDEIQNEELQDSEIDDPDPDDPENQDPENQDPEIDDPDPNDPDPVDDPDPNDPDPVDDPDPNSQLDFRIDDQCNPGPGEAVQDISAAWRRDPGAITLVLTCTTIGVPGPPQG